MTAADGMQSSIVLNFYLCIFDLSRKNTVGHIGFRSLRGGTVSTVYWRRRWQQYGARQTPLRMSACARTERETDHRQRERERCSKGKTGKDKGPNSVWAKAAESRLSFRTGLWQPGCDTAVGKRPGKCSEGENEVRRREGSAVLVFADRQQSRRAARRLTPNICHYHGLNASVRAWCQSITLAVSPEWTVSSLMCACCCVRGCCCHMSLAYLTTACFLSPIQAAGNVYLLLIFRVCWPRGGWIGF